MDDIIAWFEAEKEKLSNIANSGDAVLADKARNKLNYLAYMESIANGSKGPEIDVEALANAVAEKFKSQLDALNQRISALENKA